MAQHSSFPHPSIHGAGEMQRSPSSSLKEGEGGKWGSLQQKLIFQVDLPLFFIAEIPIIMDLAMVQNNSRPIPGA